MNIKKFARSLSLYLSGTVLFFLLFVLAYMLAFAQVTAKPEQIKQILAKSGIYQKIPEVIYDDSVNSDSTSSVSIPLKDSSVRQTALDTFDAGFVQKNIEKAIDGTYDWLGGKTNEPQFNIDLKDAKNKFAAELSEKAGSRLKSLPVCTQAQMRQIKQLDPLTTPCLPPGADIKALQQDILDSAKESDNFLKDTTINPATLKDSNGNSVFDSYKDVPEAYQAALKLPYVLGAICLMIAGVIVLLSTSRAEGFKKLSKVLALGGIFVILAPAGIKYLTSAAFKGASGSDDKVLNELIAPFMREFNKATAEVYFTTGLVFVLLAAAAYYAYKKSAGTPAKPAGQTEKKGK